MYNKVILIGRLGQDPELKNNACKFTLATNEKWNKDGQKQERTDWHNIVAFGKQADLCNTYLKKGDLVNIEGKVTYNKYEEKWYTSIILNQITFLQKKIK